MASVCLSHRLHKCVYPIGSTKQRAEARDTAMTCEGEVGMELAQMAQPAGTVETLREDIRLAFSMAGGVGLAVWMGGVTGELYRVLRSDRLHRMVLNGQQETGPGGHDVYAGLLDLTLSDIRVDVISGTSAGGINGAVLAFATANQLPSLILLRDVWVKLGDIGALLRPVTAKDPPSLLKGDDYFYPELVNALQELRDTRPDDSPDYPHPVHLMLTTTHLSGQPGRYPDDFGSIIHDVNHRGMFHFRHRGGTRVAGRLAISGEELASGEGMTTIRQLALAARSSASFPVAFEASFIPVGPPTQASPPRPDMSDVMQSDGDSTSGSRYVVDGGLLANRPLRPTLDAILEMRSRQDVRRVLALVIPDPGQPEDLPTAEPDEPPSLISVVAASVVGIPSNQSLSAELQQIEHHNRRLRRRDAFRQSLSQISEETIDDAAHNLFPLYRNIRARRSAQRTLWRFEQGVAPGQARPNVDYGALEDALVLARSELLPDEANVPGTPWDWGIKTVERMAGMVLSLAEDVYEALVDQEEQNEAAAANLNRVKKDASQLLSLTSRIRKRDDEFWQARIPGLAAGLATADVDLGTWAHAAYGDWLGDPVDRARALIALAGGAYRAAELVTEIGEVATSAGVAMVELLSQLLAVFALVPPVYLSGDRAVDADIVTPVFKRLLALEVLEVISDIEAANQPIEIIQVSARTEDAFRRLSEPSKKLTSVQLAHFGAFYKQSWRANDFMWGRLDGAARAVQVLLSPQRLQRVWSGTTQELATAIRDRAVGGKHETWLAAKWTTASADIDVEIRKLFDSPTPPARLEHGSISRRSALARSRPASPKVTPSCLPSERARLNRVVSRP